MEHPVALSSEKTVVFSIVANPGTTDGRVMKQAEALRDAGYSVWLFGRLAEGFPERELCKDIHVRRFDCFKNHFNNDDPARQEALDVFGSQRPLLANIAIARTATQAIKPSKPPVAKKMLAPKVLAPKIKAPPPPIWLRTIRKIRRHVMGSMVAPVKPAEAPLEIATPELTSANQRSITWAEMREKYIQDNNNHRSYLGETNFFFRYLQMAENILSLEFEAKPQIIHAHDLMALPAAIALAKRFGSRVIFDAHEIETERTPPLPAERKAFIARLEEDLLQQTADMIVCCDSAAHFYLPVFKKRLPTLVMNAPDDRYVDNAAPQGTDVRSQCGLGASVPLVVYTGSVGLEARGVDKIVKALAYLPDYHLAIQGPRNPKFDDWLRSIIDDEGVEERVHFLLPVSQEVLVDTLRSGDVGVCAFQDVSLNHRYALPNKVFEMAFADLPLCLSNLVEMRKFIEKLGNGETMDEKDPLDVARAIREVYDNRDRYRLTGHSKHLLREEYSWAAQASNLIDLYDRNLLQSEKWNSTLDA